MNLRKTYWTVSLSLLLSLSLALPYCCHADISELFSHQQEMPSSMMHGQHQDAQQCDCGHEFVKDFQKTKKVVAGSNILLSLVGVSNERSIISNSHQLVSALAVIQPGILSDSGPPIHQMNSVFLN